MTLPALTLNYRSPEVILGKRPGPPSDYVEPWCLALRDDVASDCSELLRDSKLVRTCVINCCTLFVAPNLETRVLHKKRVGLELLSYVDGGVAGSLRLGSKHSIAKCTPSTDAELASKDLLAQQMQLVGHAAVWRSFPHYPEQTPALRRTGVYIPRLLGGNDVLRQLLQPDFALRPTGARFDAGSPVVEPRQEYVYVDRC